MPDAENDKTDKGGFRGQDKDCKYADHGDDIP